MARTTLRPRFFAAHAAGKRLKKIRAAGLPEEWSGWASRGISESVFIGFIYDSL